MGNGVWGKAIYSVISKNTNDVSFVPKGKTITDFDALILCVPTQEIRNVIPLVSLDGKRKIIINTAKGIEQKTHLLPRQIVSSLIKKPIEYYALFGPSFAKEVVDQMPTLVNLGFEKKSKNIESIRKLFQTSNFRVRLTHGVAALELSGAFKNMYAIGCGLSRGLGYETNTQVKLLVLAIEEMRGLYKSLGYKLDDTSTAGIIGDLILTCSSTESRNFRFGKYLAEGNVRSSLEKVNSTVEGYHSLESVAYFKKKSDAKLPLASFIAEVVKTNDPKLVKKMFKSFVSSV